MVNYRPAAKIPTATQRMWEVAYSDFERAELLFLSAKKDPTSTPEYITMRERDAITRRSMCKAINFLITNADDINAVIAKKKSKNQN
jgi:hypothetical protein